MEADRIDLGQSDMLADGDFTTIPIGDRELLLARVGDRYFAVSNACTHALGWLDMGMLDTATFEIECPLHGGRYDLRSGEATREPCTVPIETFDVTVEAGRVVLTAVPSGSGTDTSR